MKRTNSDSVASDGFSFETQSSNVEVTRGERMRDFYEEFVYKPGLVAWDDWRTRIGASIMLLYLLIATFGVWLYRAPRTNQSPRALQPFETWEAPFGTTQSGTDIFAQAIHATPDMLIMVASGGIFATSVAVLVGTLAGYKGGLTDRVVTTISDIAMSIPGLPLVMVIAILYEPTNPMVIGVLLTINYWAGLGRSIRSQVLTLREESYVEASRTMGVSTRRILTKDIIPSLMPFILVNFAMAARYVVFASVGLYYLGVLPTGLGNWGLQLDQAYNDYGALVGSGALHLIFVPMVFIMFLGLALVLLAQGLDRVFNPRVRTRLAGESETTTDDEDDDNQTMVGV